MVEVDWKSCRPINSQTENEFIDGVVRKHHESLCRDLKSLEIGSYQGLSAAMLAQYGIVFSIDLWGDVFDCEAHYESIGQVNFTPFIQNMLRLKLIGRVFPMVSSSLILDYLPEMEFDVIYVDAAHDLPYVQWDIDRSEKHLAKDGLWIFHDYKREGDREDLGVNKAVDGILETGRYQVHDKFNGCVCLKGT